MMKSSNSLETTDFDKFYKIFFNGSSTTSSDGLNLTFVGLDNYNLSLTDFPNFLGSYNEQVKKKKVQSISNIKEIITFGKADKTKYSQFFVLLYSYKTPENLVLKAGLLIAKHNEKGFQLIGLWPFNSIQKNTNLSIENFQNLLKMIIEQKENFQDIVMIT
jgi:hypothetical protein